MVPVSAGEHKVEVEWREPWARPAGWARVPDATGLELIAQELRDAHPDSVLDTEFFRDKAALWIAPAQVRDVLGRSKTTIIVEGSLGAGNGDNSAALKHADAAAPRVGIPELLPQAEEVLVGTGAHAHLCSHDGAIVRQACRHAGGGGHPEQRRLDLVRGKPPWLVHPVQRCRVPGQPLLPVGQPAVQRAGVGSFLRCKCREGELGELFRKLVGPQRFERRRKFA